MQTMAWSDCGGIFVLVHGEQEPADAEWNRYVEALERSIESSGKFRALVFSPGTGPNMRQRRQLAALTEQQRVPYRSAVITPSTVARAIATLIALRTPDIRAFDPSQLDDAFEHLELTEMEKNTVRGSLNTLRRQMGFAGDL